MFVVLTTSLVQGALAQGLSMHDSSDRTSDSIEVVVSSGDLKTIGRLEPGVLVRAHGVVAHSTHGHAQAEGLAGRFISPASPNKVAKGRSPTTQVVVQDVSNIAVCPGASHMQTLQ